MRIGLVLLLVASGLFTAGVLTVKYKLEGLRAAVQQEMERRMGAKLTVGGVIVNGLRGLRVDDLAFSLDSKTGPALDFEAPATYIDIDLSDLLSGTISIDRLQTSGATIRVTRPAQSRWVSQSSFQFAHIPSITNLPAFRIMGSDCRLELVNVVGDTRLNISDFSFDISRLLDATDISAKLSGKVGSTPSGHTTVDLRFASMEDFDLRIHSATVTSEDLAVFLPASERLVVSGSTSPSVRVAGYPNMTLVVAFEAPFSNILLRNQPAFLAPVDGTLTGMAQYDTANHSLAFTAARVESPQISGTLDGSVSFATGLPDFDLRFEATNLPIVAALDQLLEGKAEEYGTFGFQLREPFRVSLALKGTPDAPAVSAMTSAEGATFSFAPKDSRLPSGTLELGAINLAWDSESGSPAGSCSIVSGSISRAPGDVKADKITGSLKVERDLITISPLIAEITGNPFVGSLSYEPTIQKLKATAAGTLAKIEKSPLASLSKDLSVSGAVALRCTVEGTPAQFDIEGHLDATQAEVGALWWFLKPSGLGATLTSLKGVYKPKRSFTLKMEGEIASSQVAGTLESSYEKGKWAVQSFKAESGRLDVNAVGKCLTLPYTITGGKATEATYEWRRVKGETPAWESDSFTRIDAIQLLPNGAAEPLRFENVEFTTQQRQVPEQTGALTLRAEHVVFPPLGSTWFVPMKTDPKVIEKYPDTNRHWAYDLAAQSLELPPWKGSDFKATGHNNMYDLALDPFSAAIEGGGELHGAYRANKPENTYTASFQWNGIPASYLLNQLDYPHVLEGSCTGQIRYAMDRDDPATLKGTGDFDIRDGQFSADFLVSQLQGRLQDQVTALPMNLRFSQLRSNIALAGDTVTTTNINLASQGMTLTGSGSYVREGDMNYEIKLGISPEVALQIPVIRENLSVQGHKIAQQNIELAFKIAGPTFNPRGQLQETPPIGITLVSSALEATSDAIKVIDIPRKVLVDLLRIGGGIVGVSK